ncbi:diguanylate cyclase [Stenotrophomonas geniculata]|uniref:putative bifunctional diguanylate cyclase/phosphodiesterase n=1 Tax=Stenotrophomonas geniculata TaxID=86188 RepID=UPI00374B62A7
MSNAAESLPGPQPTPEDLLRAIDNGQLHLLYQPKLDCSTGQTVGVEALVRWAHPRLGLIPPAEFIQMAEQGGVIDRLGQWVLHAACRQLRHWRERGNLQWSVAVNVSPLQLECARFAQRALDCLVWYGVPSDQVVLEVTESTAIKDVDIAESQLATLAAAGVQISLDDFGTGFSSLARLRQLPLRELKIDRAFVAGVDRNEVDPSIIAAIVGIGNALKLRVVAEGVEREEQLQLLRTLGCHQTQGYLHAPPISGDLFLARFGRCRVQAPATLPQVGEVVFG